MQQLVILFDPPRLFRLVVVDDQHGLGRVGIVVLDNQGQLFLSNIVDVDGSGSLIVDDHLGQLHLPVPQLLLQIAILHTLRHQLQVSLEIFNVQVQDWLLVLIQ
jgi:hypothetical protein